MSLEFKSHAIVRMAQRRVSREAVEAIVRKPLVTGDAGDDRRYATGRVQLGARFEWLTVVTEEGPDGRTWVVTVYVGTPTAANRRCIGNARARLRAHRLPAGARRLALEDEEDAA